jgi:hypothetical protein
LPCWRQAAPGGCARPAARKFAVSRKKTTRKRVVNLRATVIFHCNRTAWQARPRTSLPRRDDTRSATTKYAEELGDLAHHGTLVGVFGTPFYRDALFYRVDLDRTWIGGALASRPPHYDHRHQPVPAAVHRPDE